MKYKCLSIPHQVLEAWREVRYSPTPLEAQAQEMMFLQAVGQSKKILYKDESDPAHPIVHTLVTETVEDPQRPITRSITKMFRMENNLYYTEFLEGESWGGEPVNTGRTVGKFKMPVFKKQRNRETGTFTITGIRDLADTYDIPFTTGTFTDPSTGEETSIDELYKMKSPDFVFYVRTPTRKYALRGITLEEFKNKPFTDLIHYGEKGSWPEKQETPEAPKRRVKADD